MINSYETIIVEEGIENKKFKNLSYITTRFFNDLLKHVIQRMKKDFCQENYKKIYLFFRSAFGLTLNYYKNNDSIDMSDFKEVEVAIAHSFE